MRKTSVRKFIHAVIDVLPLLVIPIFALNILHKETEPISITTGGYEYQNIETNEVQAEDDLIDGNAYSFYALPMSENTYGDTIIQISLHEYTNVYLQNLIEDREIELFNVYFEYYYNGANEEDTSWFYVYNSHDTMIFQYDDIGNYYVSFIYKDNSNILLRDYTFNDLMKQSRYNFVTYSYNDEIVYNNTDIGSQFIYALYKPVHDYFNFNNLFNMGAIYDWIQLNLFSGTAPLPIFIIWNVIVYEFFVDLIFLLYGVFMFIIDFAEKCLERPFRR